jgi:hypothetical protein
MRAFATLALVGTAFAAANPYEPDHTHPDHTWTHTRPTGYLTISREHPTHSAPPYPYVKRHTTPHVTESHTWPHPTGYHSHYDPSETEYPHYDPPARVRKRGKRHTTPHVTESHTWPHPTGYLTISREHPTHSPPPYPYVKRHTTPHITESHTWPHPTGSHTWPHPDYVKRHGTGYPGYPHESHSWPHPTGHHTWPHPDYVKRHGTGYPHQPTGGYSAPPSTFATATRYAATPTAQPEYIEQREEKAPLKLRCYLGLC